MTAFRLLLLLYCCCYPGVDLVRDAIALSLASSNTVTTSNNKNNKNMSTSTTQQQHQHQQQDPRLQQQQKQLPWRDTNRSPLSGNDLRNLVIEASTKEEIDDDDDENENDDEESSSFLDVPGIAWLEHINLIVGINTCMNNNSNSDCTDTDTDTRTLAEKFYIDVMGMTPDKSKSFHVNLGRQQFHLAYPKKESEDEIPHRIHGSIGIAFPDINTLKERLIEAKKNENSHGDGNGDGDKGIGNKNNSFCNTLFDFYEEKECYDIDTDTDTDDNTNSPTYYKVITVRCPWGNVFRCYSAYDRGRPTVLSSSSLSLLSTSPSSLSSILPSPQKMTNLHSLQIGMHGQDKMGVLCEGQPGIRFIELLCPYGSSDKVYNFYRKILQCSCYCTTVSSSSSSSSSSARSPSHCRNVRQNTTTACCIVSAGPGIHLVFVEEDEEDKPKLAAAYNDTDVATTTTTTTTAAVSASNPNTNTMMIDSCCSDQKYIDHPTKDAF